MCHPGTQHSWQTAIAFQEGNRLSWYATSIFYDPAKWPYRVERWLPRQTQPIVERIRRRCDARIEPCHVRQLGPWGWIAAAAGALASDHAASWTIRRGNRDFVRRVVALMKREPVDLLWAYDTAALEAFRWAKPRGIYCVLDRTIGHSAEANRVLAEEYVRHPDFFSLPFAPKPQQQLDEEQEEMELADTIVVGSQACADTLTANGCPAAKIHVLGYGYDERLFSATPPSRTPPTEGPIDFLFVGNVAARKGVAYLLEAFEQISPDRARLTLVGRLSIPPATLARYQPRVRHIPAVSRAGVTEFLDAAHCFVFPSLFEGSALVLREIYGAGLGAMHTRAAGQGVVAGRNGVVWETASVEAILHSVEAVLDDPSCLARWQDESWAMRQDCSWSVYRRLARQFVDNVI